MPLVAPPRTPTRLTIERREYSNAPLRAGKGSAYEGGIRVPCLVRWPGMAKAGQVSATPIHVVDWMPTLLAIGGGAVPASHTLDGTNIAPVLRGKSIPARPLYWYQPLYDVRWGATPSAAIREGDWKLIEYFGDWFDPDGRYVPGPRLELFNLATDLGETTNVAAEHASRALELRQKLRQWLAAVPAPVPNANRQFDESRQLLEVRRPGSKKGGD